MDRSLGGPRDRRKDPDGASAAGIPGAVRGHAPSEPAERAVAFLRLGLGVIWSINLIFVLVPANAFFATFSSTAVSFESTSLVGPGLARTVALYAPLFSGLIAATTLYLAVAFLTGVTVRIACLVGGAFSGALLLSQWTTTFAIPGGTDVGPHPIYLVAYLALLAFPASERYSLRSLVASLRERGGTRMPSRAPSLGLSGSRSEATREERAV